MWDAGSGSLADYSAECPVNDSRGQRAHEWTCLPPIGAIASDDEDCVDSAPAAQVERCGPGPDGGHGGGAGGIHRGAGGPVGKPALEECNQELVTTAPIVFLPILYMLNASGKGRQCCRYYYASRKEAAFLRGMST